MKVQKKNIFNKFIRGKKYRKIIKARAARVIAPSFYGATALRMMYKNLDMASVTEYPSPKATDYKLFFGDNVIMSQEPLPNFTIKFGEIVIEKSVQDVFYARGGNRAGWGHFLTVTFKDKPVDLVKNKSATDLVKQILIALAESGRIKSYDATTIARDDTWAYSR